MALNDITEEVHTTVGRMIARAAVKKKDWKPFEVDLEKCYSFIDQQIELIDIITPVPNDPSAKGVKYQNLTLVHNGTPKTFQVPISHTYTSDCVKRRQNSQEVDIKGSISANATAMQGDVKGDAKADVSAQYKKKKFQETYNEVHQEHHIGEMNVAENADMCVKRGEYIYNIQLKLRALKKAKLEVHQTSFAERGAQVGAGVRAAVGGGAGVAGGIGVGIVTGVFLGAMGGSVVPGPGTIIGGIIGGVVGALGGGAAVGAGAAGAGAAIGAGAGAAFTALSTIELTAEDIFQESFNIETVKGDYICCTIDYIYTANFDLVTVNNT